jgi:predicted nucleic acid-binding protein
VKTSTAGPKFVLDTSALFALKEDEPGADDVEDILRASGPKGKVYVSFISMMEFFYIVEQEQGQAAAKHAYLELKQLPLQVIHSDEELCLAAGRIKAAHRLSVADAWVAATAEQLRAILVHKDPEFIPMSSQLQMQALPFKKTGGKESV